jgi:2'-5' RNA ligase
MSVPESALVVIVPESEQLVGRWRRQFDQSATHGVPAHITVLYPFVPPDLIDDEIKNLLRGLFERCEAFDFSLHEVRRFQEHILYLTPSPEKPFDALTRAVADLFPEYPPYEGRFQQVLAHLTVADRAPLEQLDLVEADLSSGLPIFATARHVSLLVGRDKPQSWRVVEEFPLSN